MIAAGPGIAGALRLALALDGALPDVLQLLGVGPLAAGELRSGLLPSAPDIPAGAAPGAGVSTAAPAGLTTPPGAAPGPAPSHDMPPDAAPGPGPSHDMPPDAAPGPEPSRGMPANPGRSPGPAPSHDMPPGVSVLLADPWDVPTLVACGAADAGIAPKHVLAEVAADVVQLLDLGVGDERVAYVAAADRPPAAARRLRIATAHPRLTRRHFARMGQQIDVLELRSVAEAAALTGAADGAVLTLPPRERQTAGGLVVQSDVLRSSARLVVNRSARVVRPAEVAALVERLRAAIGESARGGA